MKVLIDKGADVNYDCSNCSLGCASPIGMAVTAGQAAAAKFLLDAGVNPNEATLDLYRTWARKSGNKETVELVEAAWKNRRAAASQASRAERPQQVVIQNVAQTLTSDIDQTTVRLPQRPSDFAVVVGIEKYSNDLPDARFAERDANAVKNHLVALGYPERNIKLLIGNRATKGKLDGIIEAWLPRMAKPESNVFFYFSGHGAPDTKSNQAYLVPWDGDPSLLNKTAYPLKKLYAHLNALKAKRVIVALDSCFSGAGGRSVLSEGARPLVTKVDASVEPGGKIVLFAASSPSEITATLKEQGHGIFTYYFLKGLGGEAKDSSGVITSRGLYDYLKPKVQDAAARQNRDQTPVLEGATAGAIARFK